MWAVWNHRHYNRKMLAPVTSPQKSETVTWALNVQGMELTFNTETMPTPEQVGVAKRLAGTGWDFSAAGLGDGRQEEPRQETVFQPGFRG